MTTPQKLTDYVKVYNGFLNEDICRQTTQVLASAEWTKHTFYDAINNRYHSYDHELAVSHAEIPQKQALNQRVWDAIHRYITVDFKDFAPWFSAWQGFSSVRFNRYDPDTRMKLHCDHIHSLFDGQRKGVPVLTVLGALNNEYKGGEFVLFGDQVVPMPAGTIIVFPSTFMYPHEVRMVTEGIRYSFVSWTW